MKVTHNAPPGTQAFETNRTGQKTAVRGKAGTDPSAQPESASASKAGANVEISDKARLMQQASAIAMSAPDVRKDRVAQLKKSIAEGTYQVDSRKIADKLVDEHLGTDFGKNNV